MLCAAINTIGGWIASYLVSTEPVNDPTCITDAGYPEWFNSVTYYIETYAGVFSCVLYLFLMAYIKTQKNASHQAPPPQVGSTSGGASAAASAISKNAWKAQRTRQKRFTITVAWTTLITFVLYVIPEFADSLLANLNGNINTRSFMIPFWASLQVLDRIITALVYVKRQNEVHAAVKRVFCGPTTIQQGGNVVRIEPVQAIELR